MVTSKCTQSTAAALAALLGLALALAATPALAQSGDDDAPAPPAQSAPSTPQLDEDRGSWLPPDPLARPPAPPPPRPAADPFTPALHHGPVSSATSGEPLTLRAHIDAPHLVKTAYVVYQAQGKWLTLKLLRTEDGYAGTIPAEHVQPPGLAYTLEMELADGTRGSAFASRAEPHTVVVRDDPADVRERWLLDRIGGRRSVVAATGEVVRFGTTEGDAIPCAAGQTQCKQGDMHKPIVDDQYWRVEASYTYRPMRIVSEFGFRLGVVRGRSLVRLEELDATKYDVGLNYAGAGVRFRLADILHTDLEVMGNVTETGFSSGAGAAVHLGDPLGTKFTLGWQTIGFQEGTYFGTRFYTRLDLAVNDRITIAPSVEATDMPHAEKWGVRLLADTGFTIGRGFTLWVRGGYQARIARSGGPALGATVQYAF